MIHVGGFKCGSNNYDNYDEDTKVMGWICKVSQA